MHSVDTDKAREKMMKRDLDVLIAGSLVNTSYCTGYYSTIWSLVRDHLRLCVIPMKSKPFVTCPEFEVDAYTESGTFDVFEYPAELYFAYSAVEDIYLKAKRNVKDIPELVGLPVKDMLAKSPILLAAKILKSRGLGGAKVGIDKEYIEAGLFQEVLEALPDCELVDATQIFVELRAIKSDEEIRCLREAVRITEDAIETSAPLIKEGGYLKDVWQHYANAFYREPLTEPACLGMAVSPTSSGRLFPAMTSQFCAGQIFRIDLGARYNHYAADVSRQWAIGDIPQEETDRYHVILQAADAMTERLHPGAKISEVYWAGNNIVRGMDPNYGRRVFMGHAIGLEIHERPYVTPFAEETLKPGMVLAVEVPYYAPDGYSYSVEDDYLITEDGCERLTNHTPRTLSKQ